MAPQHHVPRDGDDQTDRSPGALPRASRQSKAPDRQRRDHDPGTDTDRGHRPSTGPFAARRQRGGGRRDPTSGPSPRAVSAPPGGSAPRHVLRLALDRETAVRRRRELRLRDLVRPLVGVAVPTSVAHGDWAGGLTYTLDTRLPAARVRRRTSPPSGEQTSRDCSRGCARCPYGRPRRSRYRGQLAPLPGGAADGRGAGCRGARRRRRVRPRTPRPAHPARRRSSSGRADRGRRPQHHDPQG